ncbi:MAG: DUF4020 domain-containing protein [Cyanobacteria bacterium MAG CAR3_bin_5]|nr:DUF4020 domain-containing protein [Cyanobacteria bacterium MAG CAR3_bin_5]
MPASASAMKIGGVDFPEPVLNALRDGRLVVFAGAGVSMGPPARLPSFRKLAEKVAEGTGKSITASETDDQFLGRLEENGVKVHQRTAETLQPDNLKSNALHRNLLRLFQKTDPVRVVTTNFDCLFEQVAEAEVLFKNKPKVFEAPALPPGSRFKGIVRLHGSVNEPEEMVLTHRDFGRAYLTEEDGWARRFLVSLFANHTVLFVGYSHNDTIMTYLTPSLPPDDGEKRFALVGSTSNDFDRWRRMGIEPVVFPQENKSDFTSLDRGVKSLANFRRRGVIGWQQEITRIAEGEPPMIDGEDSHTIDHALKDVKLTQFFVRTATSPKWIDWLNRQGHLKRLFAEGELEERDKILCGWLAVRFARNHSDELFSVICHRYGKLNRHLWRSFVFQLDYVKDNSLDPHTLSQWVHILMNCIPMSPDEEIRSIPMSDHEDFLWSLAEHCIKVEVFQSFLQVYDSITARLAWFLPDSKHRNDSWDYNMKQLWEESLQPNLPKIVYTLLERATMRLEQRHSASVAWSYQNNSRMDDDSFHRSAIEPHEQDEDSHRIDPLIDTVRDCLKWLSINDPMTVRNWCNRFISSNPPLLRRLAIHATNARQDLSADDKMAWLLEHFHVNEHLAHHEIFRMAACVYPQASCQQREKLIHAIYKRFSDDDHLSFPICSFNWFSWLHKADPNCDLVKKELDNIKAQNPEFEPREHPDFAFYWSGFKEVESPWTAKELLAKPASEWLPDLLVYQPDEPRRSFKHNRIEMLQTVNEVAQSHPAWGLALADAMAAKSEWESDLWYWVISAWEKAELDQESKKQVLSCLSTSKLYPDNSGDIADVLRKFLQGNDSDDVAELLDKIHSIATTLYSYAAAIKNISCNINISGISPDTSWFTKAINHPFGKLAQLWVHSIGFWCKQQAVPPKELSAEYRRALDAIMESSGLSGQLGRTILAREFNFLNAIDSLWAEQHLLPLFDAEHEDFVCAWDGFMFSSRLSSQLLELLRDKIIGALRRGIREFPQDMLKHFVRFYVTALGYFIENAQDSWISEFFKHVDKNHELKHEFAVAIRNKLSGLNESEQKEWWNVWLKDYWNDRLHGVPCPLDNEETATMLQWLVYLQGVFPEAVDIVLRMPSIYLDPYSSFLRRIAKTKLIGRYPQELTKLLIHLGKPDHLPWSWKRNLDFLHKLQEKSLPDELAHELDNLIRRIKIS